MTTKRQQEGNEGGDKTVLYSNCSGGAKIYVLQFIKLYTKKEKKIFYINQKNGELKDTCKRQRRTNIFDKIRISKISNFS